MNKNELPLEIINQTKKIIRETKDRIEDAKVVKEQMNTSIISTEDKIKRSKEQLEKN